MLLPKLKTRNKAPHRACDDAERGMRLLTARRLGNPSPLALAHVVLRPDVQQLQRRAVLRDGPRPLLPDIVAPAGKQCGAWEGPATAAAVWLFSPTRP